ncbi:MAG: hypothetical protein Kow00105_15130 [Phycisphaeraceae bacterium]
MPQKKIIERYYEHHDTIQSNKLSQIVSDLWLAEPGTNTTKLWGQAQVALMRMGVDANRVAQVVDKRDVEALAALVKEVDTQGAKPTSDMNPSNQQAKTPKVEPVNDTRTIRQMQAQKAAEGGYDSLEKDNLKRAMKAFRKKLKSIRRDDESKLGNRYTTYGKKSSIVAITPPHQYPAAVWEKLVEQGRLKRGGQGTYSLAKE